MHSRQAWMQMRVNALFTHDTAGRMRHVNDTAAAPAPRFFLGRTSQGHIWRFRHDLPALLVSELEKHCQAEPIEQTPGELPFYVEEYTRLLQMQTAVQKTGAGPAYVFPAPQSAVHTENLIAITTENVDKLSAGFADWIEDVPFCQPFLALVQSGQVVSLCCSVRITAQAHEAGVETLPHWRRKGYAATVVAGWASAVRALGAVPFYSTAWSNRASQAVANKLGLIQYGTDFHIL